MRVNAISCCLILSIVATLLLFSSCSKLGLTGISNNWYTYPDTSFPKASDFHEVNTAINKSTVLSYSQRTGKPLTTASYSTFVDNKGYLTAALSSYFDIPINIWMVHFINNNTLEKGWVRATIASKSFGTTLYSVDGGSNLGKITYCWLPIIYTYVQEGNKIVSTDGDVFTLSDGKLLQDGSSTWLVKYKW